MVIGIRVGGKFVNSDVAEVEAVGGVFPLVASLATPMKEDEHRECAEYDSASGGERGYMVSCRRNRMPFCKANGKQRHTQE